MSALPSGVRAGLALPRLSLGPLGPVSRRRAGRSLLLMGLFPAGGSVLAITPWPALQALGLGLAVPGGGFSLCGALGSPVDTAALGMGGAATAAFGLALFLWFATGNLLAPPAVWLGSAAAAALYAVHHGCLGANGAGVALLGFAAGGICAGFGLSIMRGQPAPALRAAETQPVRPSSLPASPTRATAGDLSEADLARLRFLLDRALQPLERFGGFERLDPFQSAALRYQLQFAGFALALVQRHHLPALGAYLTQAQANLIEKARDHRVWRYWALESFWGRGRIDANPFAGDNVMYTGFCAAQIALFQAASGDRRYDRLHSFSLRHPSGQRFEADGPGMVANLARQHAHSPFGLIACEPNWLFPVCNSISYIALAAHEAQAGTTLWRDMAEHQRALLLAEFRDRSGRFVTCRSSHTGWAMPPIGGVLTQLLPSFFLNATLPDVAHENWAHLRDDLLHKDGSARLDRFWPIDVGNYRSTRMAGLCGAAATAVELGDEEIASAMLEALEARHPLIVSGGVGHRRNASIWTHAFEIMARCGRRDGLRDLVSDPAPSTATPHIASCHYPDALVARAFASACALDMTLVPSGAGGPVRLGLAGLRPSRAYIRSDDGSGFTSDGDGTATLELTLTSGRRILVCEAA